MKWSSVIVLVVAIVVASIVTPTTAGGRDDESNDCTTTSISLSDITVTITAPILGFTLRFEIENDTPGEIGGQSTDGLASPSPPCTAGTCMAWVSTRLTLITSTLYVIHTALPSDPSAVPTQSCSETPTPPSQTTDPATSQQIPSSAITKSNPEDLLSTAASLSQSSEPLLLHAEDWPPDSPTGSVLPELAASTAARPSRPLLITTILLIPLITL